MEKIPESRKPWDIHTKEIIDAIYGEFLYQRTLESQIGYTPANNKSCADFMLIMETYLNKAKIAYCTTNGNDHAMDENRIDFATGINCAFYID